MLFTFIAALFITYYITRLLDIESFTKYFESGSLSIIDSVFLIATMIWMVYNVFLHSGPIVLLVTMVMIILDIDSKSTFIRRKHRLTVMLLLMVALNVFIVFNLLYLKIEFWNLIINL
jgi:hypothetical protein